MNFLKNKILVFLFASILGITLFSCSEQKLIEDNILQVDEIGVRKGVFERRFRMTDVYNNNQNFTVEILKSSIDKLFLPNYLLINDAYDIGFDKNSSIANTMLEFKINLISSNHPVYSESLTIPKSELLNCYKNLEYFYNYEIIQHDSYYWADSIYKKLSAGNSIDFNKNKLEKVLYPRRLEFRNSKYGQDIPIELFDVILELEEGEIATPIQSGPIWTIVKLIDKYEDKKLDKYDNMVNEIVEIMQPIMKNKQAQQLTDELKVKYNVKINDESIEKLFNSYEVKEEKGYFSSRLLDKSELSKDVISTSEENFDVKFLIFMLNRSNVFVNNGKLTLSEVEKVVHNISDAIVFYFDGLEKGVDKIEFIKDQIVNKQNKLLYTKYLKDEISAKVIVSDEDAKEYYNKNRDKWSGEFINVRTSVISNLREKLLYERIDELVEKFKNRFTIQYNEVMISDLAKQFTIEKANKVIK